ncbi:unnamed protein product [Clonostachys rosea]|uniref:Uncharacterized protein n=1 Tax=Bionectria ochroleuca TaxID=29856 RepID=A0ABY6U4G9_BIOOC|nr:unnamed protein product [Clonostachys rosea]
MPNFLSRVLGALNAIGFILGLCLTALRDDLRRNGFQARPERIWKMEFENAWHIRVTALIVLATGALTIATILARMVASWTIILLGSPGKG